MGKIIMPGIGLFETAVSHGVLGVSALTLLLSMGLTYKVVGVLTSLIQQSTAATQRLADGLAGLGERLDRIEGRLR